MSRIVIEKEAVDVKESVRQQFSAVAANYSTSSVHAAGVDLAKMVQVAAPRGDERMLDAGCGAGHTALTFAAHVKKVVAVDLSAAMLDQVQMLAKERGLHNIQTKLGDVEDLAFDSASFDLVASRYSAHHWPHPQTALREIRRVLKPGGQFILSDIISFDDFTADTFVQAIELLRDPSHVRDHTAAQWIDMLDTAGLRAEVAWTWDVRLEFSSWVTRMATPPDQVALIRKLLDIAPREVRQLLRLEADHSFTFQGGLLRATMMER